jgi:hypothetical protein
LANQDRPKQEKKEQFEKGKRNFFRKQIINSKVTSTAVDTFPITKGLGVK